LEPHAFSTEQVDRWPNFHLVRFLCVSRRVPPFGILAPFGFHRSEKLNRITSVCYANQQATPVSWFRQSATPNHPVEPIVATGPNVDESHRSVGISPRVRFEGDRRNVTIPPKIHIGSRRSWDDQNEIGYLFLFANCPSKNQS
jgi:hypothetical protein